MLRCSVYLFIFLSLATSGHALESRTEPKFCEFVASTYNEALSTLAFRHSDIESADILAALEYLDRVYESADRSLVYQVPVDLLARVNFWGRLTPPDLVRSALLNFLRFDLSVVSRPTYSIFYSKRAQLYLREYFNLRALFAIDDPIFEKFTPLIEHSRGALRFLPYLNQLPQSWKSEIRKHWFREDPLTLNHLVGLRLSEESEAEAELWECGQCTSMSEGHLDGIANIGRRANDHVSVSSLIYVGEHLIGTLKDFYQGHPSLLALQSFTDARGRVILGRGMVYMVAEKLVDLASARGWPREIRLPANSDFPVKALLSLNLYPDQTLNGEEFFDLIEQLKTEALSRRK